MQKKIAVLEGDGIGPEIVREAVKVLQVIEKKYGHKFDLDYAPFGAGAYFTEGSPFPDKTKDICDRADSIEDIWEPIHSQLWTPAHATAAEAIPQLYAIFRMTDGDFRKGLFWASNFGRDADTIAAVVGALAGAKHGMDVIPSEWVEIVRKPSGVALKFSSATTKPIRPRNQSIKPKVNTACWVFNGVRMASANHARMKIFPLALRRLSLRLHFERS